MRHVIMIAVLVLGACAGSGPDLCEANLERLYEWQCEACPDTSWCPGGQPHAVDPARCADVTLEMAQAQERADACSRECYEEQLAAGVDICVPNGWRTAWGECRDACLAR